jgi:hypothetical protein
MRFLMQPLTIQQPGWGETEKDLLDKPAQI